jgi:hypothetical protein
MTTVLRSIRPGQTFQRGAAHQQAARGLPAKVSHSLVDGLAPEKAFRDSYCSGC